MWLAMDTVGHQYTLALGEFHSEGWHDHAVTEVMHGQDSDACLVLIDRMMRKKRLSMHRLTGLVYGAGPGRFTGVRLGAAFINAIALAYRLPIYNVPSFHALAFEAVMRCQAEALRSVTVVQDAGGSLIYIADYHVIKHDHGYRTIQIAQPLTMLSYDEWFVLWERDQWNVQNPCEKQWIGFSNSLWANAFRQRTGEWKKNNWIEISDRHAAYLARYACITPSFEASQQANPIYMRHPVDSFEKKFDKKVETHA